MLKKRKRKNQRSSRRQAQFSNGSLDLNFIDNIDSNSWYKKYHMCLGFIYDRHMWYDYFFQTKEPKILYAKIRPHRKKIHQTWSRNITCAWYFISHTGKPLGKAWYFRWMYHPSHMWYNRITPINIRPVRYGWLCCVSPEISHVC